MGESLKAKRARLAAEKKKEEAAAVEAETEVAALRTDAVKKTEHDEVVRERDKLKLDSVTRAEYNAAIAAKKAAEGRIPQINGNDVTQDNIDSAAKNPDGTLITQQQVDEFMANQPKCPDGTTVTAPSAMTDEQSLHLKMLRLVSKAKDGVFSADVVKELRQEICLDKDSTADAISFPDELFDAGMFCRKTSGLADGADFDMNV